MTVMPQEDFMLHGLHSDYRVHVNGQYGPLGFVDSATLRATSRLWRKLRARYLKVGGGNTSARASWRTSSASTPPACAAVRLPQPYTGT